MSNINILYLNRAEEYLANAKSILQKVQDISIDNSVIKERFEQLALVQTDLEKSIQKTKDDLFRKLVSIAWMLKTDPNIKYVSIYFKHDSPHKKRFEIYSEHKVRVNDLGGYDHKYMTLDQFLGYSYRESVYIQLEHHVIEELSRYPEKTERLKKLETDFVLSLDRANHLINEIVSNTN